MQNSIGGIAAFNDHDGADVHRGRLPRPRSSSGRWPSGTNTAILFLGGGGGGWGGGPVVHVMAGLGPITHEAETVAHPASASSATMLPSEVGGARSDVVQVLRVGAQPS